jgi:hypothetical protein
MKTTRGISGIATCLVASWAAPASADAVSEWNMLAVQCTNTAANQGPTTSHGGPANFLDLALVHAAMHDAIQAIEGKYEPYLATPSATGDESKAAAAAAAAHRVLSTLCPTSTAALDALFAPYRAGENAGLAVGFAAGDALLAVARGTPALPPFRGGTGVGEWRPTTPSELPMAFLYLAEETKPYTLTSSSQFRPGPPPDLVSRLYAKEYNEVKQDGGITSHPAVGACPAPRNTDAARFWSGNYSVIWNQAARDIALDRQLSLGEHARLLALVNLAASDAGIAVWDSKLHYNFWRPLTAINLGDTDGNRGTVADPTWRPFIESTSHFPPPAPPGVPSQNPAYPDYVSGANGVSGAAATTLQLFFRTDELDFEIHKATPASVPICRTPRTFHKVSDAMNEVVDARILLGIHFRAADEEAKRLGTRVAFWTFTRFLKPIRH